MLLTRSTRGSRQRTPRHQACFFRGPVHARAGLFQGPHKCRWWPPGPQQDGL